MTDMIRLWFTCLASDCLILRFYNIILILRFYGLQNPKDYTLLQGEV